MEWMIWMIAGSRLTRMPYNWMLDSTRRVQRSLDALPFSICVIRGEVSYSSLVRIFSLAGRTRIGL
jgi:hypothetical protein